MRGTLWIAAALVIVIAGTALRGQGPAPPPAPWRGAGATPCVGGDGGIFQCPPPLGAIAIRAGRLIARKFGRLTRVLRKDYEAWLASARPIAPAIGHDGAAPLAALPRRSVRRGAHR